jgi:hypothetical protein
VQRGEGERRNISREITTSYEIGSGKRKGERKTELKRSELLLR